MSKTVDSLKKVMQERAQSKYTTAMHRHTVETKQNYDSAHDAAVTLAKPESVPAETAPVSPEEIFDTGLRQNRFSFPQNALLVILVAAGLLSVGLNVKTFTEIRKTKNSSASLTNDLRIQTDKVASLEKNVAELQAKAESAKEVSEEKIKTLTLSLRAAHSEIANLAGENRQLKQTVSDLRQSYKSLDNKYSKLAETVEKLKSSSAPGAVQK